MGFFIKVLNKIKLFIKYNFLYYLNNINNICDKKKLLKILYQKYPTKENNIIIEFVEINYPSMLPIIINFKE